MSYNQTKPIVFISKCLGFANCRYDGQIITDTFVTRLQKYVEFFPVCPEVEIGLGIPRSPIRLISDNKQLRLIQPATEKDVSEMMRDFVSVFLSKIDRVDGFILKTRSPSCGIGDVKIFIGTEKSALSKRGSGFFGEKILQKFKNCAIEDEGRLKNFVLREHFLTKLFTIARFRQVKTNLMMRALVEFHTRHKLLLLAYNQHHYRKSGKIVANLEKLDFRTVVGLYEQELIHIFKNIPRDSSMINTLQHAFGWISKNLSKEEKRFFLDSIEEYKDERIPLSTLIHLLHAFAIRFNSTYLLNQLFLNPYPRDLIDITDSGKGRNFS